MSPIAHNIPLSDTVCSHSALSVPLPTSFWVGKREAATAAVPASTCFNDEALTRILVPISFAASMPMTVYVAWSLVRRSGGGIWLLHVVQANPRLIGLGGNDREAGHIEVANRALRRLRNLAALLERPNVTIGALVRVGQTSDEICTVAEALRVNAIVIGEMLPAARSIDQSPSLAELIERNASCTVLRLPFRPEVSPRSNTSAKHT